MSKQLTVATVTAVYLCRTMKYSVRLVRIKRDNLYSIERMTIRVAFAISRFRPKRIEKILSLKILTIAMATPVSNMKVPMSFKKMRMLFAGSERLISPKKGHMNIMPAKNNARLTT
jgi:hypothetical protein